MSCFPSGVCKAMTWKAAAAVALVAIGYAPLLASLVSVPLSPLESVNWNYKALPHPRQTTKRVMLERRVGMEVGRKRDVEGASHQLLPPPQMTPGPDTPGSHFQLASGNSSWALALPDEHGPLRGAKEQISGSWWYSFTSAISKRVWVKRNGGKV